MGKRGQEFGGAGKGTAYAQRRLIIRLFVGQIAALVLLVFATWYTGYAGRVDLVKAQRAGCERSKLDRAANARGWREAERARLTTAHDQHTSPSERASAGEAANVYAGIAAGLEARSRIDCSEAFPAAGVFG